MTMIMVMMIIIIIMIVMVIMVMIVMVIMVMMMVVILGMMIARDPEGKIFSYGRFRQRKACEFWAIKHAGEYTKRSGSGTSPSGTPGRLLMVGAL